MEGKIFLKIRTEHNTLYLILILYLTWYLQLYCSEQKGKQDGILLFLDQVLLNLKTKMKSVTSSFYVIGKKTSFTDPVFTPVRGNCRHVDLLFRWPAKTQCWSDEDQGDRHEK